MEISGKQRKSLLLIARESIENAVRGEQGGISTVLTYRPDEKLGVFVTLYKHGALRGCIGYLPDIETLRRGLVDAAVHAAVDDPRFEPVTRDELPEIVIEISLLTPLQRVNSISEIKIGRDGLYIESGFQKGLLLPKVAVEYHWDVKTFLGHTCKKAGLPPDAWKEKGTKISRFSAEVVRD